MPIYISTSSSSTDSTDTIGDLINEVYREWLEPPSAQPVHAVLDGDLSSGSTTITYLDTYMSAEEQYMMAPGSLIEIESELIRIGEVDEGTNKITVVRRGAEGTVATAHAAGATIKLSPKFPRQTIFTALKDSIAGLFPPLYAIAWDTLSVQAAGFTEIPADVIQPISALSNFGDNQWSGVQARILNPFPPSSTNKAAYFPGAEGQDVIFTYRAAPAGPTAEDDLLSDLGIQDSWKRILKVDVVLEVASNADIGRLSPEFTATTQDLELAPVLAASEIRQRLIQYREYLVERARDDLDHKFGGAVLTADSNGYL